MSPRDTSSQTLVGERRFAAAAVGQSGFAADDTRNYQGAAYGRPKFIVALAHVCSAMA